MNETNYPYAGTKAAKMLASGVRSYTDKHSIGLRGLAAELQIKQAASLSQMTTGRIGIPLDRAVQLATKLQINVPAFCFAVIEQRAPEAVAVLEAHAPMSALAEGEAELGAVVRTLASQSRWSSEKLEVLGEVAESDEPRMRWLYPTEVVIGATIRGHSETALPFADAKVVGEFVEGAFEVLASGREA